jgi:hypothetical protein
MGGLSRSKKGNFSPSGGLKRGFEGVFMVLIFLLLMVGMVAAFVSAAAVPAHPPGAVAPEMVLSGYSVYENVVTPDTVLAVQPASFLAVPVYNDNGLGLPQIIKPVMVSKPIDYPLRL